MAASGEPTSQQPGVTITPERDAPNPRLRVVLRGQVKGGAVVDAFVRLYTAQPEVVFHDRLFDLTGYRAGFGVEDLRRLQPFYEAAAKAAGRTSAGPSRTAFVTTDANFRLWTASMGFQFSGREFGAFDSFEAAERFLDTPLEARARPVEG